MGIPRTHDAQIADIQSKKKELAQPQATEKGVGSIQSAAITLKIPTVKSCGPFSLKIVGLMIGFCQLVIHCVAFLVTVRFSLDAPLIRMASITLLGMAVNVAWIYGIQKKKVIFMIPAFIPFVAATFFGIIYVSILPVGISIFILYSRNFCGDCHELLVYIIVQILFVAVVTCITIIEYSLYKSLEETRRRESTRLPYTTSCPPQTLTR